jgi:hypothetical protein
MSLFTPGLNDKGRFRLGDPLATLLNADLEYTCVNLQTIQAAASSGIDVLETYYLPLQLDAAALAADIANNAFLVTLQAGVAPELVIPSTYFAGKADTNGIRYLGKMVALDLAILPADFDLSPLRERLLAVVKETIGVVAESRTIITTNVLNKSQDEHAIIEATRATNTTQLDTDYARYLAERSRADSLQQKVNALTAYIIENHS